MLICLECYDKVKLFEMKYQVVALDVSHFHILDFIKRETRISTFVTKLKKINETNIFVAFEVETLGCWSKESFEFN